MPTPVRVYVTASTTRSGQRSAPPHSCHIATPSSPSGRIVTTRLATRSTVSYSCAMSSLLSCTTTSVLLRAAEWLVFAGAELTQGFDDRLRVHGAPGDRGVHAVDQQRFAGVRVPVGEHRLRPDRHERFERVVDLVLPGAVDAHVDEDDVFDPAQQAAQAFEVFK